ncbi:MAG: tRNA pseudouridine(55) synthase TruB [Bacteroidales bacterium]|nr:tRNA pseudouridine(55) synthase TruB [Bacteroidales bacterium]
MNFLDGEIIYIDKPLGWTSFDVVKRTRGAITRRLCVHKIKVGHAGTLDPLATGVMILTTGRATRRIEELQAGIKEYIATIALGATTPSFDLETEIDGHYPTDHITEDLVKDTLKHFTGRIEQIPPAYSAIKIDGERAYLKARRGDEPVLKPKILVIDEIELLAFSPETITIRVVCSKGTYIRALARDIGQALGSGAHLTALRRTRVGNVTIDKCLSVAELADKIRDIAVEWPDDYAIPPAFTRKEAARSADQSLIKSN